MLLKIEHLGTITDHADDVAMVSVEDAAGLEGGAGDNIQIPVTAQTQYSFNAGYHG